MEGRRCISAPGGSTCSHIYCRGPDHRCLTRTASGVVRPTGATMTDDVTLGCILKINQCKAPNVVLLLCWKCALCINWIGKLSRKRKRTGSKTKNHEGNQEVLSSGLRFIILIPVARTLEKLKGSFKKGRGSEDNAIKTDSEAGDSLREKPSSSPWP